MKPATYDGTLNRAILMTSIALLAIVMAIGSITPALAGVPNMGATIVDGDECGMLDGDGDFVITTDSHRVNTNSKNGNAIFKCHAENVPNNTGKSVQYNMENTGFFCFIPGAGLTADWKEVVSDNGDGTGDATLTCKKKV